MFVQELVGTEAKALDRAQALAVAQAQELAVAAALATAKAAPAQVIILIMHAGLDTCWL